MTTKNTGGPAFPTPGDKGGNGMTLRDYFAAAALTGMLANPNANGTKAGFVIDALDVADLMLEMRDK